MISSCFSAIGARRSQATPTFSRWFSAVIGCPRRSSAFPPRATTTLMAYSASGQDTAASGPGIEPAADLGAGPGVAETFQDGQGLVPGPAGRLRVAGLGGKIAEVAQDLGLTVTVTDLPAHHEGLLVPVPGPGGLPHRAVSRGDGAESRAFGLPVTDLPGHLHRLLRAGQDVLGPGQADVGLDQVDQGEALHVLVARFPGGGQDPLEAVEAEVEPAQLQVGAAEVDHGVDVLAPAVAGLAADVARFGV